MRHFNTLIDESKAVQRFCDNVLQPAADHFSGDLFKESDLAIIDAVREFEYEDGVLGTIGFQAKKMYLEESVSVLYNIWSGMQQSVNGYGFGMDGLAIPVKDLVSEFVITAAGIDKGIENAEDAGDEDEPNDENELCYIKEVHDFYILENSLTVRKDWRAEFYNADYKMIGGLDARSPGIGDIMLSEVIEEDITLQTHDEAFASSFSEEDIKEIMGILFRLGFKTRRKRLF